MPGSGGDQDPEPHSLVIQEGLAEEPLQEDVHMEEVEKNGAIYPYRVTPPYKSSAPKSPLYRHSAVVQITQFAQDPFFVLPGDSTSLSEAYRHNAIFD